MSYHTIYQFRISHYDPLRRNPQGAFHGEAWISVHDIGQTFEGIRLTPEEYQRVEEAYIHTALNFLDESDIDHLSIRGMENHAEELLPFNEGQTLEKENLTKAFRDVLREKYWCRFEDAKGRFVHFGYDYYMYVGVSHPCIETQRGALNFGLCVEPFESPYREKPART